MSIVNIYTISCETGSDSKRRKAFILYLAVKSMHIKKTINLTAVSDVGSSPALTTCETRQVLLAGVSGGFPGVLPFRPTNRLARLYE